MICFVEDLHGKTFTFVNFEIFAVKPYYLWIQCPGNLHVNCLHLLCHATNFLWHITIYCLFVI